MAEFEVEKKRSYSSQSPGALQNLGLKGTRRSHSRRSEATAKSQRKTAQV